MNRKLKFLFLLAIFWLSFAGVTQIDLTRQVMGVLLCGNGGTGAATTSANYVLAGPVTGAASCPAFRAVNATDSASTPLPATQRWAYWFAGQTPWGDVTTETGGFNTVSADATHQFPYRIYTTGTTSGNTAGRNGALNYVTGRHIDQLTYAQAAQTTSIRWWSGVSDQTFATMAASDTPTGNYAAFRFSTGASDTTYHCLTSTGSTQQDQSSGVTADTNFHYMEIKFDDANSQVLFYIDGSLVCTNATTVPASSTALRLAQGATTLTNAARNAEIAWVLMRSDF